MKRIIHYERAIFNLFATILALFVWFHFLPTPQVQATSWKQNPAVSLSTTPIFINELHYDNAGTDSGEGVEIAGPAGDNLAGWSLVAYNGATGAAYSTTPLSGIIDDEENGYGAKFFGYPQGGLQNSSPEGLALVNPSSQVVLFLSYEGSFLATDGPAVGMTSVDIGVTETSTTPAGYSLQLHGTGSVYEHFTWQQPAVHTYDSKNTGQTFQDIKYKLYCPLIIR